MKQERRKAMRKIKSVRDQVYEHVVHMIRTGELDFGEKVNILELQEVLEVSRPPINEALIQLAADGFLDNIPRKGFFVKALTRKEIDDMFDIITVLDIHVLEKVMDNVTDRNIDMLRMIVSRMDEAIEKRNIDAYIFEPAGICNFSLEEITGYYTDMPLYDGPFALIMNKAKWESLPEEYRTAIDAISGKEASLGAAQAFADDVEVKRDQITAAGGQFLEVTDEARAEFSVAADAYAETWVNSMSKNGFDAAAYLADAKAFAQQFAG